MNFPFCVERSTSFESRTESTYFAFFFVLLFSLHQHKQFRKYRANSSDALLYVQLQFLVYKSGLSFTCKLLDCHCKLEILSHLKNHPQQKGKPTAFLGFTSPVSCPALLHQPLALWQVTAVASQPQALQFHLFSDVISLLLHPN